MKKIRKILLTGTFAALAGATLLFGAACGEKTVEYTFDTLGGGEMASVVVKEGDSYTLPEPTREGYSFEGWYTSENFVGDPVTTVVASENVTYYAKWEQLYALTLELDGGSLAGTGTTLYLKSGAKIYDAVKSIVPTKGELQFGAWFNGNIEMTEALETSNAYMPKSAVTLKAKYKAAYTVEFYGQTLADATKYELIEENLVGYEYVGASFDPEMRLDGFSEISREPMDAITISTDKAENVVKLYYKRNDISVIFWPNYPSGGSDEKTEFKVKYGQEVEILSDYTCEGYCLIGWATELNGDVVYQSNNIQEALYNGSATDTVKKSFEPTNTTQLFGVWAKGYTDMFGGDDYIYWLDETSEVIYLCRGNQFFEGTYRGGVFSFKNTATNKTLLTGRLNGNKTFLYFEERLSGACTLYRPGVGLVEDTTITFDSADGITYRVKTSSGYDTSTGTYTIDDEGYYIAKFNDGSLKEQTLTMIVGQAGDANAFQVRNDHEVGNFLRCFVQNGELLLFNPGYYDLTLDGFGTAIFNAPNMPQETYSYTYDEDGVITLINDYGNVEGYARVVENEFVKCYAVYDPTLDGTFKASGSDATLTLDGQYNATYKNGDAEVTGLYSSEISALGGMIVRLTVNKEETSEVYTFYLTSETEVVPDTSEGAEAGATVTKTTYTFDRKLDTYAEYYYTDKNNVYYAPLIVIDEEKKNNATIYGFTADSQYVAVLYGTYQYDSTTGWYVFTTETNTGAEAAASIFDLKTIQSIVFALDSELLSYRVHYWYTMTTEEGPQSFGETYTAENGDTLTFVAGFAVYKAMVDGELIISTGRYTVGEEYTTAVFGGNAVGYFVLSTEGDNKTFVQLQYLPYVAYRMNINGTYGESEYLSFDGLGGVKYVKDAKEYVGVVSENGKTSLGDTTIYRFVANEDSSVTFDFVVMSSSVRLFGVYNEKYSGTFLSDDGVLKLDGYGSRAEYTDVNGDVYISNYIVDSETVLRIMLNEERYVDLGENKSFMLRGAEYGKHELVDNQTAIGKFVQFDGYDQFTVFEENDAGEPINQKSGSYSIVNGEYTLTFEDGSVWTGETLYSSSKRFFIIEHAEIVQIYVNEIDWSVLILDGVGNATKYTVNGVKDSGYYTLITENLLYFINTAQTDACIYEYDASAGTATPIQPDAVGYYTTKLESLMFTEYGFAIFNGKTQYYFNEEDDGAVYIYRLPEDGEDVTDLTLTKYGYIKMYFGTFDDLQITWTDGNIYYRNSDYRIPFTRLVDGTEYDYPVPIDETTTAALGQLLFMPSGAAEFTVQGYLELDGVGQQPCYVTRDVLDDGETVEMYITIGYYRFDIEVNFTGENEDGESNNTYKIVRMRYILQLTSYEYLDLYYRLYSMYGSSIEGVFKNTIGEIGVCIEFDADAKERRSYATGTFGAGSGMYDVDGNIVTFEEAELEMYDDGMNVARFKATDGETYKIYFAMQSHSQFPRVPAYVLLAFVREQKFTVGDYNVYVERLIVSEYEDELVAGSIFGVDVTKTVDGEEVAVEEDDSKISYLPVSDTQCYLVVTEKNEDKVQSATYYKLTFTEDTDGAIKENIVPKYKTVVMEIVQTTSVAYTANGVDYVAIITSDDTTEIVTFTTGGETYVVTECTLNGTVYAVTTADGKSFQIKVNGNVVEEITEVSATEAQE